MIINIKSIGVASKKLNLIAYPNIYKDKSSIIFNPNFMLILIY